MPEVMRIPLPVWLKSLASLVTTGNVMSAPAWLVHRVSTSPSGVKQAVGHVLTTPRLTLRGQ